MAGYEDFVKLNYKPKKTDLLVSFRVEVPSWEPKKRSFGAVASESSVGTWATVAGLKYKHVHKVAGKVYETKKDPGKKGYWIKVAYPQDHFEAGNMSQILASIAGNVFGMKAVSNLRLQDIRWPKKILKSFPGPQFGISGCRNKIFKLKGKDKKRPLMLSVPKPKVGMTTREHCDIAQQIWSGGLDLLKDDENLTNQFFNPFKKRVALAHKIREKIEKQTGEKKSYLINVTAPHYKEMEKRVKYVASLGWEFVMIDIATTGWQGVHSLRELCKDYKLAIHAHRAFHGSFTRNPRHGFSMLATAEVSRLLGVDNIHIGTAGIGKLVGSKEEVLEIQDHITKDRIAPNKKTHTLGEDWLGMKAVNPCSSGGLHPILIPEVCRRMGTNLFLQIGGGIHGHPKGSHAGAIAMRAAVEAYMKGMSIERASRTCKPLQQSLDFFGYMRPR